MNIEMDRFLALRERLFTALTEILTHGGGPGKSYDGEMSLKVEYPCGYDDDSRPRYVIELDCYLIGPGRHYRWVSHLFDVALYKAEKDIDAWIAEEREYDEGDDDD